MYRLMLMYLQETIFILFNHFTAVVFLNSLKTNNDNDGLSVKMARFSPSLVLFDNFDLLQFLEKTNMLLA